MRKLTFSRAFREFADSELGRAVHEALVREHLTEELIGHISKDSTAIEGNERPQNKRINIEVAKEQGTKEQDKKKRGRPKKGEVRTESKEESRIQRLSPAEKIRYNERTVAERTNSWLKEDFGGRNVKRLVKKFKRLLQEAQIITVINSLFLLF